MADLPRYFTLEFTDVLVPALHEDPVFQKAARKFDETIQIRAFDTPDGKDVQITYRVQRGRVTPDVRTEDAPSSMRGEPFDGNRLMMRTTAPYEVWKKLDRGEMGPLQALTHPGYVVDGSKMKLIKNIGVFNAMNAVAARTPKSY